MKRLCNRRWKMDDFLKIFILGLFVIGCEGGFAWSSPEYAEQAKHTTCKPMQKYELAALKTDINSPTINRTSLGAVLNAEVCGGLCCEMENCDLAEFNKKRQCYAVQCSSLKSCDVGSDGDSVILTFGRKAGSDVWTRSFTGNTRSKIIDPNTAEKKIVDNTSKKEEIEGKKPMDELLKEQLARVADKEKELQKTWTAEEMAKADFSGKSTKKSDVAATEEKENANLGKEIQSITGEHYLKADDKGDITALQENDTSTVHSKSHQHRRDARHNIISPITIGAFTCMAVIAVSGFAMAIIKYKKERKEVDDKQTQLP